MAKRLELIFRCTLILLFGVLLWSVWSSAQAADAPVPNDISLLATNATLAIEGTTISQTYLTFGLDRVELLQRQIAGIPAWQYIASLIYVFLAFFVSKLLDQLFRYQLKKLAERTETRFDDVMLDLMRGPVRIIAFVILLHVGLQVFDWPGWAEQVLRKGLYIIVAVSLTYVALKFVDLGIGYWRGRSSSPEDKIFDDQLVPIISHTLKAFVVIVAVLLTCQNLGLNITSLIAVSSVTGIAVGLAAQDTLANIFGAIGVFVDKPFRVGDTIKLDAVTGTVESIGLRSTRVRNGDGHFVTVPNKMMGNSPITNITRRQKIKTVLDIGVTYDTPAEKIQRASDILREIFSAHPKTADLLIGFNRFDDSALNITVIHWWNSTDFKEYLAGMQELNLAIKQRFDREGINFAFPTRTLYLKQDSEWRLGGNDRLPDSTKDRA